MPFAKKQGSASLFEKRGAGFQVDCQPIWKPAPLFLEKHDFTLCTLDKKLFSSYNEIEINTILKPCYEDAANLRRVLITEQIMLREHGRYWLTHPHAENLEGNPQ